MALFDETFDEWQASDFAAFEQRKWASNRFNLARGRVRQRLIDLLQRVQASAGVADDDLEVWSSPDHPKLSNGHKVRWQAVALCRTAAMRRAIERVDPALDADDVRTSHVHLGIVLEHELLRVLLMLPAAASLDQTRWQQAERLWSGVADRLGSPLQIDDRGVRIELQVTAQDALEGGATINSLAEWVSAAMPAFEAARWQTSHDSDGVGAAVQKEVAAASKPQASKAKVDASPKDVAIAPAGSKTAEPRRPRRPYKPAGPARTRSRGTQQRRPTGERPATKPGGQGRQDGKPTEASKGTGNRPQRDGRETRDKRDSRETRDKRDSRETRDKRDSRSGRDGRDSRKPRDGRDSRKPRDRREGRSNRDRRSAGPPGPYQLGPTQGDTAKPTGAVTVGARVSLQSGLFAGKEGEVLAIHKGKAEVSVGLMKVKVAVGELSPV